MESSSLIYSERKALVSPYVAAGWTVADTGSTIEVGNTDGVQLRYTGEEAQEWRVVSGEWTLAERILWYLVFLNRITLAGLTVSSYTVKRRLRNAYPEQAEHLGPFDTCEEAQKQAIDRWGSRCFANSPKQAHETTLTRSQS